MTFKLFIDDERYPVEDDYHICRSYDDVVDLIEAIGLPLFISFDHDLGTDKTGYDIAKFICDYIMDNDLNFDFEYYVHSQNPVGKKNIEEYLENFRKFWDETEKH